MPQISLDQYYILSLFLKNKALSSSDVHKLLSQEINTNVSLTTIKRELAKLKDTKFLLPSGAGRSVVYSITSYGRLFLSVNPREYVSIEPDKRYGLTTFNFDLFDSIEEDLFSSSEIDELNNATHKFQNNSRSVSQILKEKELERFIIELSWKSSKIEGNTYTLFDTEKLISKGIEAAGHDKAEARMILNHKDAFKIINENVSLFTELKVSTIEEIHKTLVKDLNVSYGLREKAVGVTGSLYRPLDNIHQIKEAMRSLCDTVNKLKSPYAKALIALLGLSYIQPFEDGNKRTSRLIANAILLVNSCAPLSYRSVDENEYREAVLVFYELNSLIAFKKIFIEQYTFAAHNYLIVPNN